MSSLDKKQKRNRYMDNIGAIIAGAYFIFGLVVMKWSVILVVL